MPNQILQAIGLMPSPTVNTAAPMASANALMNQGANRFMNVLNQVDEAAKAMRAARALQGIDTSDPWSVGTNAVQTLLGIGVAPKAAVPIAKTVSEPAIEKIRQQNLQDYRAADIGLRSRPEYVTTEDEFGNIYAINKRNPEDMTKIQSAPTGFIPPKYIDTDTVTETGPEGNATVYRVRTNKMNGQVISKTPIGKTTKPLSQQDKDAATSFKTALDLIDRIEKQFDATSTAPGHNPSVGPADALWATGLNAVGLSTKDTRNTAALNSSLQSLKAQLTDALVKGVPSDKDMKVIEDMMPDIYDNEKVFRAKLNNVRNILKRQGLQFTKDRLEPVGAGNLGLSEKKQVELPGGYKAVDNGDGTYTLPDGTVIRRKNAR